jgi:hypothetical protein
MMLIKIRIHKIIFPSQQQNHNTYTRKQHQHIIKLIKNKTKFKINNNCPLLDAT